MSGLIHSDMDTYEASLSYFLFSRLLSITNCEIKLRGELTGGHFQFQLFELADAGMLCYKGNKRSNNKDSPAKHSFQTSWFLSSPITVSKDMVQV